MPVVARESGAEDRLVRPLCAQNLPATLPEREGWIDRARMYGFHGRSRKPQMALAKQYGFMEYAQPAGGCCFLTDEQYSVKLADLWQGRGERRYEFDDIMLLKVGRHLRPRPHFKMIIGREEGENHFLEGYRKQFVHLRAVNYEGPLALIDGRADADDLDLAARLVCRFGKGRDAEHVQVLITDQQGASRVVEVAPLTADDVPQAWYL